MIKVVVTVDVRGWVVGLVTHADSFFGFDGYVVGLGWRRLDG
jgi:hypothetical protein